MELGLSERKNAQKGCKHQLQFKSKSLRCGNRSGILQEIPKKKNSHRGTTTRMFGEGLPWRGVKNTENPTQWNQKRLFFNVQQTMICCVRMLGKKNQDRQGWKYYQNTLITKKNKQDPLQKTIGKIGQLGENIIRKIKEPIGTNGEGPSLSHSCNRAWVRRKRDHKTRCGSTSAHCNPGRVMKKVKNRFTLKGEGLHFHLGFSRQEGEKKPFSGCHGTSCS